MKNLPRTPVLEAPKVSVIVPVLNEEKFITEFLDGLCLQDFSSNNMEILLADGNSTDKTLDIAQIFMERLSGLVILNNPKKQKAPALNMCIEKATGDLILIMDCHTHYPKNYISGLIACLRETESDYVGGCVDTAPTGDGLIAKAISLVLSHPFGVGGGTYRTSVTSGEGLAPFGCYRRELPFCVGGYNERLPRTHDDEFIARIMRAGGKCWVCGDICSTYFTRGTIWELLKQMFGNGENHIATFMELPGHFFLRHYVPFFFVICLILGTVLSALAPWGWIFLFAVLGPYLLLDLTASLHIAMENGKKKFSIVAMLFPLIHLAYGLGTLWGLIANGIFCKHRKGDKKTGKELIRD